LTKLPVLLAMAEEQGRDPAGIELGVFGCPPDPAIIDQYAEVGFTRCVIPLPPAAADEVRRALDTAAVGVDQYVST
jgi:hypothetical protein